MDKCVLNDLIAGCGSDCLDGVSIEQYEEDVSTEIEQCIDCQEVSNVKRGSVLPLVADGMIPEKISSRIDSRRHLSRQLALWNRILIVTIMIIISSTILILEVGGSPTIYRHCGPSTLSIYLVST
eukprot:scaffold15292_cov111-Skeletonema_dohrnii-CCMP3373.AAC.1